MTQWRILANRILATAIFGFSNLTVRPTLCTFWLTLNLAYLRCDFVAQDHYGCVAGRMLEESFGPFCLL